MDYYCEIIGCGASKEEPIKPTKGCFPKKFATDYFFDSMPNIQFVFQDKDPNGLNYILDVTPRQYMLEYHKNDQEIYACFDMKVFEDYPIIGQNAMRGFDVGFDKTNKQVTFVPAQCA